MVGGISGHCACGQVVYEYNGMVGPANYCHCEDCRRLNGSAFNIGVRMDSAEFKVVSGSLKAFSKCGDSGRELTRHFCSNCGSPIFTSSPTHPDYVYVKAGTLDDASVVKPTHESWTESAVSWSRIDADLRSFSRSQNPDAVRLATTDE